MIEFEKSENRNINIIRYILCIPAGVLGYYMALLFLYFFSYFNDYMFGDSWLNDFLPDILSHDADQTISLFMGATHFFSLYIVYHVIPDYKRLVGLVLGAIYFIGQALTIYLSFFTITVGDQQIGIRNLNYVESISTLIGISACIYVIYKRKNLFPE